MKAESINEKTTFSKELERLFNPRMRQAGQQGSTEPPETNYTNGKVPFLQVFITFPTLNAALAMIASRILRMLRLTAPTQAKVPLSTLF